MMYLLRFGCVNKGQAAWSACMLGSQLRVRIVIVLL